MCGGHECHLEWCMFGILKSVFVIVALASVVGGATYSFFSATDTVSGNTISTATLEFNVEGVAGEEGTLAKPLLAESLVPGGFTPWARAALQNESDVPVRIRMYVDHLDGSVCPLTNLVVTTGVSGTDSSERSRIVYEGPILDIAGEAEAIEVTGIPPDEALPAHTTQHVQQRAQLDESADNGAQGKECVWDEIFIAESVVPEE